MVTRFLTIVWILCSEERMAFTINNVKAIGFPYGRRKMNRDPYLTPFIKINFKMWKVENNLPEDNIGTYFYHIGMSNDFLNRTWKKLCQEKKLLINQTILKFKTFAHQKILSKEWKGKLQSGNRFLRTSNYWTSIIIFLNLVNH